MLFRSGSAVGGGMAAGAVITAAAPVAAAGAIAYGLDRVHSNQEKKISRTQKCSETNNRGNGIDHSADC